MHMPGAIFEAVHLLTMFELDDRLGDGVMIQCDLAQPKFSKHNKVVDIETDFR